MKDNHIYFEGDKVDGVYLLIEGQLEIVKQVELDLKSKEDTPSKYD